MKKKQKTMKKSKEINNWNDFLDESMKVVDNWAKEDTKKLEKVRKEVKKEKSVFDFSVGRTVHPLQGIQIGLSPQGATIKEKIELIHRDNPAYGCFLRIMWETGLPEWRISSLMVGDFDPVKKTLFVAPCAHYHITTHLTSWLKAEVKKKKKNVSKTTLLLQAQKGGQVWYSEVTNFSSAYGISKLSQVAWKDGYK